MRRIKIKPEYDLTPQDGWLGKIYRVIYLSNTKAGRTFDIILLSVILLSTIIVMLETVPTLSLHTIRTLWNIEYFITILFTIEYIFRIITIKDKKNYIFSFNGIIDLLSIFPFYLQFFFPATHYFILIRLLRLLRVFRIFNLLDYMHDGRYIMSALKHSSRKIYIFLLFMSIFITLIGSLMYVIEGGVNGFTSIPTSIYWAVVTVTTVGYGDISPVTPLGKFLSIIVMLCGYSIIAVPTGIVTSEFRQRRFLRNDKECERCGNSENDSDARFCKICGEKLSAK